MENEVLAKLGNAILSINPVDAEKWAKKVLEEKLDVLKAMDVITEAIRQIGEGFERGDYFLPELVGAAETMKKAVQILEEEIKKTGKKRESFGIIVIGTVFGDIHDIGKNMVATFASASGFEVIDLGTDVKADKFIEAIEKYKPNILAMSALMTTTVIEQAKIIALLKEKALRDKVKVVVGGGSMTKTFAESIGADGYAPTAPAGAHLFKKLLNKE